MNIDASIVVALITLVGVIITAVVQGNVTRKNLNESQLKITNELHTQNELQNNEINHIKEKMSEMGGDLKEHNHYAKMFAETVPVLREKQDVANKRISDLEDEVKQLRRRTFEQ